MPAVSRLHDRVRTAGARPRENMYLLLCDTTLATIRSYCLLLITY
jgi:hypothetical protein